jgi:hypothetical protein
MLARASDEATLLAEDLPATGFTMATEFLPRPLLVREHKTSLRRYVLLVCTLRDDEELSANGGFRYRLRGYVHRNGKVFYSMLNKILLVSSYLISSDKALQRASGNGIDFDEIEGRGREEKSEQWRLI